MDSKEIMTKMLGVISSSIPNEEPTNPVSVWLNEQFEIMFPGIEEMGLLRRIAVSEANRDPNGILEMLAGFHNRIDDFVHVLIASEQVTVDPVTQTIEEWKDDSDVTTDEPEVESDD